jgi:hypothetical protein
LRQAWSSDPAIRDFIEMAENQWDFTAPDSIPGFGSLTGADDVPQLVAKALGDWGGKDPSGANTAGPSPDSLQTRGAAGQPEQPAAREALEETVASLGEEAAPDDGRTASAPQQDRCDAANACRAAPHKRRGHGGALPS